MATTNFLAWANGANIESDPTWASDPLRTGNIPVDAALPSPMLNKLFRQSTVFVAALAQALVAKGYSTSDANQNTLAAVLANLVTQFDLANSPALGGNPTAPTQAGSDNSTRISSTAFAQALAAAAQSNAEAYAASLLEGFVLNGNNPGYFQIPAIGGFPGFIINFGESPASTIGSITTFALAFPNAALFAFACPNGSSSNIIGISIDSAAQATIYSNVGSAVAFWFVIGY